MVTLALGLFGEILVPLDFKSYVLRDSAGTLRVLEGSTDQLMRLSDPICRQARSALTAVYRQSFQPGRIGLIVNTFQRHVRPSGQDYGAFGLDSQ